ELQPVLVVGFHLGAGFLFVGDLVPLHDPAPFGLDAPGPDALTERALSRVIEDVPIRRRHRLPDAVEIRVLGADETRRTNPGLRRGWRAGVLACRKPRAEGTRDDERSQRARPHYFFSVGSRPSCGAPVPEEPMKSLRPSANVMSRPLARVGCALAR